MPPHRPLPWPSLEGAQKGSQCESMCTPQAWEGTTSSPAALATAAITATTVVGRVPPAVVRVAIVEAVVMVFTESSPHTVLGASDIKTELKTRPVFRKHAQEVGNQQACHYL